MISIVYHCYLVNNWKEIVIEQLERIVKSGLYDAADLIFVTVNLGKSTEEEFSNLVSKYGKLQIEYHTSNSAEYPGIKKVKDLSKEYDTKIFYFHTKGVSNTYLNYRTKEYSEEKVKNIKAWRECLEYFLIDRWKESVEKLDEFDNVGVTCNNGWYWGNFWWTKTEHVKKNEDVGMWGRWDYEAWLNRFVENPKNYEWYHFNFVPYLTNLDKDFYCENPKHKGDKIVIHKAYYGTPPFHIDEGYDGNLLNVGKDVTEIIAEKLKSVGDLKLDFHVENNTMDGDPTPGHRKFLIMEISPEKDLNKIYKIAVQEGQNISFEL